VVFLELLWEACVPTRVGPWTSGTRSYCFRDERSPLCWKGNFRITLQPINGYRASSPVESVNCVLLSRGEGYASETFESHKGCQVPVRVSSGNV